MNDQRKEEIRAAVEKSIAYYVEEVWTEFVDEHTNTEEEFDWAWDTLGLLITGEIK